jgi:hypothetical protein
MSGNWQPPGQGFEGATPPGYPPVAPGYQAGPPVYTQQWGLAQPIPGYQPMMWVPRPPRPGVVKFAAALAILGIVISAVDLVVNLVYGYSNRDLVTNAVNARNAGGSAPPGMVDDVLGLTTAIGVVAWLFPVVGVIVTTVLTLRGANAARIVLVCLMGLFALVELCGGVANIVGGATSTFNGYAGPAYSPYLQLLLAGLAIAIGVLLLLPSASRFFNAGPGRRFMPSN